MFHRFAGAGAKDGVVERDGGASWASAENNFFRPYLASFRAIGSKCSPGIAEIFLILDVGDPDNLLSKCLLHHPHTMYPWPVSYLSPIPSPRHALASLLERIRSAVATRPVRAS